MPSAAMKSRGEGINHFNGIRLRLLGEGNLRLRLHSLPDMDGNQITQELVPIDMDTLITGREPLKKANFKQQRAQLEFYTTEIDEYFKINRIAVFIRSTEVNYPG